MNKDIYYELRVIITKQLIR